MQKEKKIKNYMKHFTSVTQLGDLSEAFKKAKYVK